MIRYLEVAEVEKMHRRLIADSGGSHGLRDAGGLESAVAQPQASFAGQDLYPSLIEKAAALGYSLLSNHAFIDGNKRIGQLAMEAFLMRNGYEIEAPVDAQEAMIMAVAAGEADREALRLWLATNMRASRL